MKYPFLTGAFLVAAAVVLGGFRANPAFAGTAKANLSVVATVSANCTILTAPVAFGTQDPSAPNLSTALDGTGTVTAACTTGADVTPKVTFGRANDGQTLVATIAF